MTNNYLPLSFILYIALLFSCMAHPHAVNSESPNKLQNEALDNKKFKHSLVSSTIEKAVQKNYIVVNNKKYPASPRLHNFYKQKNYDLVWFNSKFEPIKPLFSYLKVLKNASSEGLDPNFYFYDDIEQNFYDLKNLHGNELVLRIIQVDLLVSDSNLLYFSDLLFGRYQNGSEFIEQTYTEPYINIISLINDSIRRNDFKKSVKLLLPESPTYKSLKKALVKYQTIKENGGWQPVPPGPTLKVGIRNQRVVFLKYRLYASGDLLFYGAQDAKSYLNNPAFDNQLKDSVKRFQKRHGLTVDGEVGNNTLRALNIPVDQKIWTIVLNLDIWRKLPRNLGSKYVLVNVPAFKLFGIESKSTVLEMKVIVGRLDWNTPIFSEYMEYIVLNPYWNIPPSIFEDEILPELKKDPDYLSKNNIQLVSLETSDVEQIQINNWYQVNPENFNYRLRQVPGPGNPLGQLKFMLPNKHSVYLHDTPKKHLFERNNRRFSHGCIRVEKPLELVDFVFSNDPQWNSVMIQSEIDSGVSKNVYLKQPVPVHILYFTVWVENDNSVHFRDDVYNFLSPSTRARI